MIKRITYYLMQCDRCQEFLREQDGINADGFSSVDDAEKAAKEAGWSILHTTASICTTACCLRPAP